MNLLMNGKSNPGIEGSNLTEVSLHCVVPIPFVGLTLSRKLFSAIKHLNLPQSNCIYFLSNLGVPY